MMRVFAYRWVFVILFASCICLLCLPSWAQVIYSNDFETSIGSEWSVTPVGDSNYPPARISATPVGNRHFLGNFGSQEVVLHLNGLPSHAAVSVSFDLFIMRTWDGDGEYCCGPDIWELRFDDYGVLMRSTFSNTEIYGNNQTYPDWHPGPVHPGRSAALEINALGYGGPDSDSIYRITKTFSHSASTLSLRFRGLPNQSLSDESWGIDNLVVTALKTSPISGVTARQRTDGSRLVDIYYDLSLQNGSKGAISLRASSDGGGTYTITPTSLSGDVGANVASGIGKHIVWDAGKDLPGAYGVNYRIAISAVGQ